MKLSISNIAWTAENDDQMYGLMKKLGFTGLEIAPTRIFPEDPYGNPGRARAWKEQLSTGYDFEVPSMQSIWYGRKERLFGTEEERQSLVGYTKKAVDFAETIGCGNLVFGCPRNRYLPEGADESIAVDFFKEIGDYAAAHGTVIAMEANPPIYNTNYINTTRSALELIERVESPGFLLNLDLGTMIENGEDADVLDGRFSLIHHVHISEPGLKPLEIRPLHKELCERLADSHYQGFVSIEMGKTEDINLLSEKMRYVRSIFG